MWKFRSIVGNIMMGLVLTAMIGSIGVMPALGVDDHERGGNHDRGREEHRDRRGYDRGRYVHGGHDYPYGYVPPPVIYAPPPQPGIGIFFPPIIIR